ncbi:uncharacterized protein LTR77_008995 [Saxophila tyrrhenica]|uniref:Uncharacterized protein n=1 Tax=Saxophila tyrrhenica TaxID=1690608 RepID=A0AAV9P250_9PEZI|nr:hypothetical protein LTR77_008995 [Saxophila tyrrhenica]
MNLRASIARARVVAAPRAIGAQQRGFQSCGVLAVGKESAVHEEGRAEKVEAHKQDQLEKQKQGKGHWKDELASDSESIIKADRDDIDTKQTISELQKESAKAAEREKKGQ